MQDKRQTWPNLRLGVRLLAILSVEAVLLERRGDTDVVVARSLGIGDALAALTIKGDTLHELALPQIRAELSRPGICLRVVLTNGASMSEQCTWAEFLKRPGPGDERVRRVRAKTQSAGAQDVRSA